MCFAGSNDVRVKGLDLKKPVVLGGVPLALVFLVFFRVAHVQRPQDGFKAFLGHVLSDEWEVVQPILPPVVRSVGNVDEAGENVSSFQTYFFPACDLFRAFAFVLSTSLWTTEELKNSLKRERGDHAALGSKAGPGTLAGMNLRGSGPLSFSSLLRHLRAGDPPRGPADTLHGVCSEGTADLWKNRSHGEPALVKKRKKQLYSLSAPAGGKAHLSALSQSEHSTAGMGRGLEGKERERKRAEIKVEREQRAEPREEEREEATGRRAEERRAEQRRAEEMRAEQRRETETEQEALRHVLHEEGSEEEEG
ncbi:hypothetical protein F7725_023529, partial [Dissostichus mawsoni]